MTSLLLDDNWDIGLDGNGNLAIVSGNLAIAQDVACACRLWRYELWYDITLGVQYQQIEANRPPIPFVKLALSTQANMVPGVASTQIFLTGPGTDREVGGQIQITGSNGEIIAVVNSTTFAGDAPWWVNAMPS
jgi:hypothetical protein